MDQKQLKKVADYVRTCENLNSRQKAEVLEALDQEGGSLPSWLVTLLKVIAYAIGIVLAGYGTTAAAANVISNFM